MISLAKIINFEGRVKHSLLTASAIFTVLSPAILMTQPAQAGKIVVNHDEWTLSDPGFVNAPDAGTFATNVASFFTGGGPGNFHAYSTDFGFTGSSLANALTGAGHTWTVGTGITFDLPTLLTYDGIFLAGNTPINSTVLINYVNAGGNVYVAGGTGAFGGLPGAASEAAQWNTFLNAFGLAYVPSYNTLIGNLPISSSHPIFAGVSQLYHLGGQSISDLAPLDPIQQILVNDPQGGLYAVYDNAAVPEPLTLLGVGTALGFGTFFKRKLAKNS